jgi:regulatory protein
MSDSEDSPRRKPRRPDATPAQRALALLVRREHSRKELTRKLLARGLTGEDATAAVERMTQAGWQDDRRFACSLARTRASAGYGPLHIRAELGSHGLGADAVQAAFDALAEAGDDDWRARAGELIERRFGSMAGAPMAAQRKAADLLGRRGFDGDTIRAVLRGLPDD